MFAPVDAHVVAWTRPRRSIDWYMVTHFNIDILKKIISPGTLIAVCSCPRCKDTGHKGSA
jgi:hypothetical protein